MAEATAENGIPVQVKAQCHCRESPATVLGCLTLPTSELDLWDLWGLLQACGYKCTQDLL